MGNCGEMASVNIIWNVKREFDGGKGIKNIQTSDYKISQGNVQHREYSQ